ncbi:MAG TPA: hypothetical protein VGQ65_06870 [Thermoanaerobaculia bacterium]|nr:hypothetical protein [Thermoanaerobaculia bacterium]
MIKKPEMIEGPDAFQRFRDATKAVLAVPRSEMLKRIEAHRAEAAKNPNRRGPKRKAT